MKTKPEAEPQMQVEKQKIRVFTPKGYIAYFFKNVIIVATTEREARRLYETMLRKELKMKPGEKENAN